GCRMRVGSAATDDRGYSLDRTARCPVRYVGAAFHRRSRAQSPYAARMNESPHAVPHCNTAALAIWLAPAAPRHCLTISQIEFHPATWASDGRPPDVLMGSAPPSSMRPPWTHVAASPAPQ